MEREPVSSPTQSEESVPQNPNKPSKGQPPVKKRDFRQTPSSQNNSDQLATSSRQHENSASTLQNMADVRHVEQLSGHNSPSRSNSPHHGREEIRRPHSPHEQNLPSAHQNRNDEDTHPSDQNNDHQDAINDSNKHSKDNRRFTSDKLRSSGLSNRVLKEVDIFISSIPSIPKHFSSAEKTYKRNMRAWITELEKPNLNPKWKQFLSVLRVDRSPYQVWRDEWDHTLCRHIITQVVYRDHDRQGYTKQSRQAVNNAIRRELDCPSLTGKTQRGKTFRDLFRQKCNLEQVTLPKLKDSGSTLSSPTPQFTISASRPPTHTALRHPSISVQIPLNVANVQSHSLSFKRDGERRELRLKTIRASCQYFDEWDQTAFWRLKDNDHVRELPSLLAEFRVAELRNLLLDFRWIMRTFKCVDFKKGMYQIPTAGYDEILNSAKQKNTSFPPMAIEGFRLIRNALMLILPILASDRVLTRHNQFAHLATQLTGRLLNLKRRFPNIACLLRSIEDHAPRPWLRPFTVCFQPPRADVRLAVPSTGIYIPHLIALSDDGTLLAASGRAGPDDLPFLPGQETLTKGTRQYRIRLWDVKSGKLEADIPDVKSAVLDITIAPDNDAVIVATMQGLFIWHLKKHENSIEVQRRIQADMKDNKMHGEDRLAVTKNRTVLLTRSTKQCIDMWNLDTGILKRQFSTDSTKAQCIDVSTQGYDFVTGHDNGVIALWKLDKVDDHKPALCFENVGKRNEIQSVRPLYITQGSSDSTQTVMSISCQAKDEELRIASVSGKAIRIWTVPPATLALQHAHYFAFRCLACIDFDPLFRNSLSVQSVQWSSSHMLFSGGDDRIVRMWEETNDGDWIRHSIGREYSSKFDPKGMGSVLVSGGRSTDLVATYETKSPYVTVWDAEAEKYSARQKRERTYRPFCPLLLHSVDAKDVESLLEGESAQPTKNKKSIPLLRKRDILKGSFSKRSKDDGKNLENSTKNESLSVSQMVKNKRDNLSARADVRKDKTSNTATRPILQTPFSASRVGTTSAGNIHDKERKTGEDRHGVGGNSSKDDNERSLVVKSVEESGDGEGTSQGMRNPHSIGKNPDLDRMEGGRGNNLFDGRNTIGSGPFAVEGMTPDGRSYAAVTSVGMKSKSAVESVEHTTESNEGKGRLSTGALSNNEQTLRMPKPRIEHEHDGERLEVCFEGLVHSEIYYGLLLHEPSGSRVAMQGKSSIDLMSVQSGGSEPRVIENRGISGLAEGFDKQLDKTPDEKGKQRNGLGVVLEDMAVLFEIEHQDETREETKILLEPLSAEDGKNDGGVKGNEKETKNSTGADSTNGNESIVARKVDRDIERHFGNDLIRHVKRNASGMDENENNSKRSRISTNRKCVTCQAEGKCSHNENDVNVNTPMELEPIRFGKM